MHAQVDGMVKESGTFSMKTDEERELEKRVEERKRELMEMYRAQLEKTKEAQAAQRLRETKPRGRSDGAEEGAAPSVDGRKERHVAEDRVDVSPAHHRLYSDQQPASRSVREAKTKPSSRPNSGKTWYPLSPSHFCSGQSTTRTKNSCFLYFSVGGAAQTPEVKRSPNKSATRKSRK